MSLNIIKQKLTYYIESLKDEKIYKLWFIYINFLLARDKLLNYIKYYNCNIKLIIKDDESVI